MNSSNVSPWDSLRSQMPAAADWAYFDHAAVAPISGPAASAMKQWADEAVADGGAAWLKWKARREALRQRAADVVGASPDEIALVRSTTEGINIVAEGYP